MAVTSLIRDGISNSARYNSMRAGYSVVSGPNVFMAAAAGSPLNAFTSTDGFTWTQRTGASVNYNGNGFGYALVENGVAYHMLPGQGNAPTSRSIMWSSNGTTVNGGINSLSAASENAPMQWIKFNNDWVGAVQGYNGATSQYVPAFHNGKFWTYITTNTGCNILGICAYGTTLVLVGGGSSGTVPIYYSTDSGVTWTASSYTLPGTASEASICSNGSIVVANFGSQGVFSSTDLNTWTQRVSTSTFNARVHFVEGLFFILGSGGQIQTSTDGITWTSRTSGTSNRLNYVTYGNGVYVAVGNTGTITTSPTGVTWTVRTSGTTLTLHSVTYV